MFRAAQKGIVRTSGVGVKRPPLQAASWLCPVMTGEA